MLNNCLLFVFFKHSSYGNHHLCCNADTLKWFKDLFIRLETAYARRIVCVRMSNVISINSYTQAYRVLSVSYCSASDTPCRWLINKHERDTSLES